MNRVTDVHGGSRVECRDGPLGTIQRVERDDNGAPLHLRVREEASSRVIIVPLGLVHEVDDDGTIWLRTTIEDAKRFTPGAAPERSPTQRIEAEAARSEPAPPVPLHREDLVARVEPRDLGTIVVRTEMEEVPASVEVEGEREEIELEHVPVNEAVAAKVAPWYENGELVVPIYEERVVVSKQLFLKEKLRVKRISVLERRTFEDVLWRERVAVEDPDRTDAVRERQGDPLVDAVRDLLRRVGLRLRRGGSASDEERSV